MRKHGYWKIWGHSATCSECGFCETNVGDEYCQRCGAIMDGTPRWEAPKLIIPDDIGTFVCKGCGYKRTYGRDVNYCPKCGKRNEQDDG